MGLASFLSGLFSGNNPTSSINTNQLFDNAFSGFGDATSNILSDTADNISNGIPDYVLNDNFAQQSFGSVDNSMYGIDPTQSLGYNSYNNIPNEYTSKYFNNYNAPYGSVAGNQNPGGLGFNSLKDTFGGIGNFMKEYGQGIGQFGKGVGSLWGAYNQYQAYKDSSHLAKKSFAEQQRLARRAEEKDDKAQERFDSIFG